MKTLYNAVQVIQSISDSHPQVEANYYGDEIQINDETKVKFPCLHIDSQPSQVQKGVVVYNLILTVLDQPPTEKRRDLATESKAFDIMMDLLGEIKNGFTLHNISERDYYLNSDFTINPIEPQPNKNAMLIGWQTTLELTVKYQLNGCSTNIINQDSRAFSDAFSIAFG